MSNSLGPLTLGGVLFSSRDHALQMLVSIRDNTKVGDYVTKGEREILLDALEMHTNRKDIDTFGNHLFCRESTSFIVTEKNGRRSFMARCGGFETHLSPNSCLYASLAVKGPFGGGYNMKRIVEEIEVKTENGPDWVSRYTAHLAGIEETFDNLRMNLKDSRGDVHELIEKNETLVNELDAARSNHEAHKNKVQALEWEVYEYKTAYAGANEEKNKAQAEFAALHVAYDKVSGQLCDFDEEGIIGVKKWGEVEELLAEVESDNKELRRRLSIEEANAKQSKSEVKKMTAEKVGASRNHQNLKNDFDEAQKALADYAFKDTHYIDAANVSLSFLRKENDELRKSLEVRDGEVDCLNAGLRAASKDMGVLRERLGVEEARADKLYTGANDDFNNALTLARENDELKKEISELKRDRPLKERVLRRLFG